MPLWTPRGGASVLGQQAKASVTVPTGVGSWTEIIAATDQDIDGFWFTTWKGISTDLQYSRIEVGYGAASSEYTIFTYGIQRLSYAGGGPVWIPYPAPAGTRISVRGSYADSASRTVYAHVSTGVGPQAYGGHHVRGGISNTEGMNYNVGWTSTASAALNTWYEITSSIATDASWANLLLMFDDPSDTFGYQVEIATGAAASEVYHAQAAASLPWQFISGGLYSHWTGWFPVSLSAGDRVSYRVNTVDVSATHYSVRPQIAYLP